MTTDEKREVRQALEDKILREVTDPAGWLMALRRVVEALDLQPAAVLRLPACLRDGCHDVVSHADRNSMTAARVIEVIRAMRW